MGSPSLLVVIGATGTGKSHLAAVLARELGGEVINADCLQTYRGLEIATNKPDQSQQMGVPHHMLGVWDPFSPPRNVRDFRDAAVALVEDIHGRGKLPVVCGGTHYWVAALVWRTLLDESETVAEVVEEEEEGPDLYEQLCRVDPEGAQRLHRNDTRKLRRALAVYRTTGRTYLEVQGPPDALRYDRVAIVWLDSADMSVLDRRVDARVRDMMGRGLISELTAFYDDALARGVSLDDTESGILQAIGFKEFLPFLSSGSTDESLLSAGVDALCRATRRYARKQLSYIRNKLVARVAGAGGRVRVYKMDAESDVVAPALRVARGVMDGTWDDPSMPAAHTHDAVPAPAPWVKHVCGVCGGRELNGEVEWAQHLRSRSHRRAKRRRVH